MLKLFILIADAVGGQYGAKLSKYFVFMGMLTNTDVGCACAVTYGLYHLQCPLWPDIRLSTPETDLGIFIMFGRICVPKRGLHRPESIGQQHNIFWPMGPPLWSVVTFKSSLDVAPHSLAYCRIVVLQNLKFYDISFVTLNSCWVLVHCRQKICVRAPTFLSNRAKLGLNPALWHTT